MGTTRAQTCHTVAEKCVNGQCQAKEKVEAEANPKHDIIGVNSCSPIDIFYAGANILVTGATGFLGKALIEKLLRSCMNVSTIFVLIRPKRERTMEQRFKEFVENTVFDRLRWECPSALGKLRAVEGDVSIPDLGLSPENRSMLQQRVSIVFHGAATVRFDEPLKTAVNLNTRGTDRIIELCKTMSNLVCLVHVSTAYSNANLHEIQEMVYSTSVKPQTIMDMCENLDDETMAVLEKRLMGKHPNTYTLTKGLAEQVILDKGAGLPAVAIVRPSIVCAAFREPFPGWIDNFCGITGILMEIGRGTVRSIVCKSEKVVDVVPVDYVVDTLICVPWHVTMSSPQRYGDGDACPPRVYNCTSGSFNPIKWGEIGNLTRKYAIESPTKYVMWYPHVTYRTNQFIHKIAVAILHFLPAFVIDLILRFRGCKPIMIKMTKRTMRAVKSGEFFACNEWRFHTDNMKELIKHVNNAMSDSTQNYNLDITKINWEIYVHQYVLGIRKYLLKDSPDTLTKARSKLNKLYWIRRITQLFGLYMMIKILTRVDRNFFL